MMNEKFGAIKNKVAHLSEKQKIMLYAAVIGIVVLICLAIFLLGSGDRRIYREADRLLEEKKYDQALEILKPLMDEKYGDSEQFTYYIEGKKRLESAKKQRAKREDSGLSVNDQIAADFSTAQIKFDGAGEFRDSKEYSAYCSASQIFIKTSVYTDDEWKELIAGYSKAGNVEGTNALVEFLKGISSRDCEEAAKAGKTYIEAGGSLLRGEKLAEIAGATSYSNEMSSSEQIENSMELAKAMFEIDEGIIEKYAETSNEIKIDSLDMPGLGTVPSGAALVVNVDVSYRGLEEYKVDLGKTGLLGEKYFPQNPGDVEYLMKVYTIDENTKDYSDGGVRVPGITQSIYVEVYDLKEKAVIAKSRTVKGPKLGEEYSFVGPVPPVVTAAWPGKQDAIKKLIGEMTDKISTKARNDR